MSSDLEKMEILFAKAIGTTGLTLFGSQCQGVVYFGMLAYSIRLVKTAKQRQVSSVISIEVGDARLLDGWRFIPDGRLISQQRAKILSTTASLC